MAAIHPIFISQQSQHTGITLASIHQFSVGIKIFPHYKKISFQEKGIKACGYVFPFNSPIDPLFYLFFLLESSSLTVTNVKMIPLVCLIISPSLFQSVSRSPQPQMCSISTQKPFPRPGYNKQLFAVWNNKDYHHGYSSIP